MLLGCLLHLLQKRALSEICLVIKKWKNEIYWVFDTRFSGVCVAESVIAFSNIFQPLFIVFLFFWILYCLSFCELRCVITLSVSSNVPYAYLG